MDIVTYALCKKMASGKGEKGDKGDKGDQGLPGRDGVDGVTPNLQVGDVVTLEAGQQASIIRRGDDENPIFDFAIPKGDTGKDGIFVGRVDDAPDHAQVVVNDDASPYDLFFENANISYMGDTYTSLKEKADADIEYLLREIQTQHYEGQRITATNTYQKQVKSAILKGKTGYRDKDTGEILETFEEGRNLELVSVTMPVLTASTFIPMYSFLKDDGGENFTKLYTEFYEVAKDTFTFKQSGHYQRIGITTDNFEKEGKQTLERNKEYQFKIEILENTLSIDMEIICNSKFTDGVKRIVRTGETPTYEFSKTITSEIPEDDVHGSGEMILFYLPSGYNGEVSFKVTIGDGNINNIKTNILSIPIENHKGFNGMYDTVNCITGEHIERIGEIVLDGSENWIKQGVSQNNSDLGIYYSPKALPNTIFNTNNVLCDKFKTSKTMAWHSSEEDIYVSISTYGLKICFDERKLESTTVEGFKKWLSENTPTIQYPLVENSIKTVDLNGQKVYSYDGTTHYTTSSGVEGHPAPILSIDVPTNLPALVSRQRDTIQTLSAENEALKEEVAVVDQQRESGDLELLSSDFDLDFRLMEIEFALDIPIAATFKEVRNMARTPYEMAKILILGGKYERSDMEYKLGKYLERKQITQAQYDELIALMEANELVV